MIQQGALVQVVGSKALKELGLKELTGRSGIMLEDLTIPGRTNRGYMVLFSEAFKGEFYWFIPEKSVVYVVEG